MKTAPFIIRGGGLWGGLLAYRLHTHRPEVEFILYEKESHFGGEHTWSFHGSDLSKEMLQWLQPFITHQWPSHKVKFPGFERELVGSYHQVSSARFDQVLRLTLPEERYRLGTSLTLEEAHALAPFTIEATGPRKSGECGYQKFLGWEVELAEDHGLDKPLLMDASVEQIDGFRFFYLLPYGSRRLLIEDTRYSTNGDLDEQELRRELRAELKRRGWELEAIIREERGILPIPTESPKIEHRLRVIELGHLFHDTTGYSLPFAVRLIHEIAELPVIDEASVRQLVSEFRHRYEGNRRFFRLLNKLLFKAARADEGYRMLAHFYRRPESLVRKFYAAQMSFSDKCRFFVGRPPVSLLRLHRSFL